MIKFILLLGLVQNAYAFDFKFGKYDLIDGDENLCEDSQIIEREGSLIWGTRYSIPHYKEPTFKYQSDDKQCNYQSSTKMTKDSLENSLIATCKNKSFDMKRIIQFKYLTDDKILITLNSKNKIAKCTLKFLKEIK